MKNMEKREPALGAPSSAGGGGGGWKRGSKGRLHPQVNFSQLEDGVVVVVVVVVVHAFFGQVGVSFGPNSGA